MLRVLSIWFCLILTTMKIAKLLSLPPCCRLGNWGRKSSSNLIILSKALVSRSGPLDHYLPIMPLCSHLIPSYKKMAMCWVTVILPHHWALLYLFRHVGMLISLKNPNLCAIDDEKAKIRGCWRTFFLGFSVLCHLSDHRVSLRWKHWAVSFPWPLLSPQNPGYGDPGPTLCIMLSNQSCLLWNIHASGQKWAIEFIRVEHQSETQTSLLLISHFPSNFNASSLMYSERKICFKVNKVQKIIYFNTWNEFCKQ